MIHTTALLRQAVASCQLEAGDAALLLMPSAVMIMYTAVHKALNAM